jgi:peptidyl-dipeptidase Dcp
MMQLETNWIKRTILTTGISIALGASAAAAQAPPAGASFGPSNPFYAPSALPFQAPPFDKIKDSDYQPAIDAGMAQQIEEVEAIANNAAPPTFENTVVALERSGQLLDRASAAFNCVTGANTNDDLQKVQEYEAPRLAAHQDAIYLNSKLFARVKAIYDRRASLHLDAESLRLVEYDYQQFVKAGANLSDADKAKLKKINEEDSTLENAFMNKLLAATKAGAFSTTDQKALAGLSEAQMAAAAQAAQARKQQGWVAPLQNTTQQPDLTFLADRATRKAIFENSWNRTERGDANDTRSTIARLAQLRAEKGALLGFQNFAAWDLTDQMAKTPEGRPRSQRHPGAHRRAAWRVHPRALGLGVLFRTGAQGQVRFGRVRDQALFRVEQRA